MPRFLSFAPRLAACFFFLAAAAFFGLNPAALKHLHALNILQFNLQGVSYAWVMALFAYALPGTLLTSYFGWQLFRGPTRFRAHAALIMVAGTLLLQLGALSTAPTFPGRTNYLWGLTCLFPTLHSAAWLWNALTGRANERRQRLTNAAMGLFLWYFAPGQLLFGPGEIDEMPVNLAIVFCFAWHASRGVVPTPPPPVLPAMEAAPHSI